MSEFIDYNYNKKKKFKNLKEFLIQPKNHYNNNMFSYYFTYEAMDKIDRKFKYLIKDKNDKIKK